MIIARYTDDLNDVSYFTWGRDYEVLDVEWPFPEVPVYRIVDDMDDGDYLFPASWFTVVGGADEARAAGIPDSWISDSAH